MNWISLVVVNLYTTFIMGYRSALQTITVYLHLYTEITFDIWCDTEYIDLLFIVNTCISGSISLILIEFIITGWVFANIAPSLKIVGNTIIAAGSTFLKEFHSLRISVFSTLKYVNALLSSTHHLLNFSSLQISSFSWITTKRSIWMTTLMGTCISSLKVKT